MACLDTDGAEGLHWGGLSQGPRKSHRQCKAARSLTSQILTPGVDIFFLLVTTFLSLLSSPWEISTIDGFPVTCAAADLSQSLGGVASPEDTGQIRHDLAIWLLVRQEGKPCKPIVSIYCVISNDRCRICQAFPLDYQEQSLFWSLGLLFLLLDFLFQFRMLVSVHIREPFLQSPYLHGH